MVLFRLCRVQCHLPEDGTELVTQSASYVDMFKNYIKTAFRNLGRQKGSTFINISGLTMGITCSLVLFLLVRHLSSFDTFHANQGRIYRVVHQADGNQGTNYTSGTPSVLPDAFRLDFPEAEQVVFTSYKSGGLITIPQRAGAPKKYNEEAGIVYTSSEFFKVFDHDILMGEHIKPLEDPNQAVISKRWAKKYFGKEEVLGEIVKFENKEYKISAVIENPPGNTDFPFDLMLSYITIKKDNEVDGWNSISSDQQTYFLLKKDASIATVESRMKAFTDKYLKDNSDHALFSLQPLSEIHFDDRYGNYNYNTVSRNVLLALNFIAVILILTACINFINLATAEAIKRSKEVGIRKSLGSTRGQLIRQFLGETTIVAILSMIVSLAAAQLALMLLNPFLETDLKLDFAGDTTLWLFIVAVTMAIALLSGLYPAFIVSGYNPVLALKNLVNNRNSSGYNLRRALVVTQFVISQFFIFGTIVLVNQMSYYQTKDLGFRKDAVIMIPIPERESPATGDGHSKMRTLRDQSVNVAGISAVSLNSTPPSSGSVSSTDFQIEGNDEHFETQMKQIDGNYLNLFDIQLVAGKNIADLDTASEFLVNEKLCKIVGIDPQEAVGKILRLSGKKFPIAGVVKDFHTMSLHEPIEATVLLNRIRGYRNLSVKVNLSQVKDVIAELKPKWEAAYPEHIFDYSFLDEEIREFYETEQKMSVLLAVFSGIAIFIGCLGLFGLASFLANQKTKEIGVRKVLGASVESIVLLFSKEYIALIVAGFLFAAPLAWYVMSGFLEEFTYKITIGPEVFLIGLSVTLLIAMLTVGFKSFRAAVANPANSLRSE